MAATYTHYNDLPSLQTAIRSLDNSDAELTLQTKILYRTPPVLRPSTIAPVPPVADKTIPRDAFARHQAFDNFGIQLLHRHFPLYDSDILLEDHAVTQPFPKPTPNIFPSDRIVPKSWFFLPNGTAVPYEYRITLSIAEKEAVADIGAHAPFVSEIHAILSKHNLLHILGLSALGRQHGYGHTDTVRFEKTFNNRNICFDVGADEIGSSSKKDVQTSLWVFHQQDYAEMSQDGVGGMAGAAVSKLLCFSGCMCQRVEDDNKES